jgi:hypothetical protein
MTRIAADFLPTARTIPIRPWERIAAIPATRKPGVSLTLAVMGALGTR